MSRICMVVAVFERFGISVPLTGTAMEIVSSDDGTGEKTRGFHMMDRSPTASDEYNIPLLLEGSCLGGEGGSC